MNALKFKQIIYLISVTVVVTVAAQVYTNVQNYRVNKQRFERDVQQALDLAVEAYYADRARNDVVIFAKSSDTLGNRMFKSGISVKSDLRIDSTFHTRMMKKGASWTSSSIDRSDLLDSLKKYNFEFDTGNVVQIHPDSIKSIEILNSVSFSDTSVLQQMAKKLLISLTSNGLDFDLLTAFLDKELDRKEIGVAYTLIHSTPYKTFNSQPEGQVYQLSSLSKSTYLPVDQSLELQYENASLAILKRGAFDLFISLLIIAAVVGSLLYLYKVINEQKQLAEIKNDLISNITHEFKTPIATISTAIEGIAIFNQNNDPEKTKKYLGISSDQLKKLNTMVEKLLETATLDSDEIDLAKEPVDIVHLTKGLVEKFDMVKGKKELSFSCELSEHWVDMDIFHMENAISNLIDNALKYGGNRVSISLKKLENQTVLAVTDTGGLIDKPQQARIFEKFYRVPTGNVHNVKGFGIGLYYTKAMIEKHGGAIDLNVGEGETTFKITI